MNIVKYITRVSRRQALGPGAGEGDAALARCYGAGATIDAVADGDITRGRGGRTARAGRHAVVDRHRLPRHRRIRRIRCNRCRRVRFVDRDVACGRAIVHRRVRAARPRRIRREPGRGRAIRLNGGLLTRECAAHRAAPTHRQSKQHADVARG